MVGMKIIDKTVADLSIVDHIAPLPIPVMEFAPPEHGLVPAPAEVAKGSPVEQHVWQALVADHGKGCSGSPILDISPGNE